MTAFFTITMKRGHTPLPNSSAFALSNNGFTPSSSIQPRTHHQQEIPDTSSNDIGASFKRIRISTSSPGELALASDLAHLVSELSFYRSAESTWFTLDNKVKLVRDPVDSLRLSFGVATDAGEEWTFCIQVPRMYPHQSPVIYRSSCKNWKEERQLPAILVLNNPDPSTCPLRMSDSDGEEVFASFVGWSPVCRLKDLCQWLIDLSNRPNLYCNRSGITGAENQCRPSVLGVLPKHMNLFGPNRFDVGFPKKTDNPRRSLSLTDIGLMDATSYDMMMTDNSDHNLSASKESFLISCGSLATGKTSTHDQGNTFKSNFVQQKYPASSVFSVPHETEKASNSSMSTTFNFSSDQSRR